MVIKPVLWTTGFINFYFFFCCTIKHFNFFAFTINFVFTIWLLSDLKQSCLHPYVEPYKNQSLNALEINNEGVLTRPNYLQATIHSGTNIGLILMDVKTYNLSHFCHKFCILSPHYPLAISFVLSKSNTS